MRTALTAFATVALGIFDFVSAADWDNGVLVLTDSNFDEELDCFNVPTSCSNMQRCSQVVVLTIEVNTLLIKTHINKNYVRVDDGS